MPNTRLSRKRKRQNTPKDPEDPPRDPKNPPKDPKKSRKDSKDPTDNTGDIKTLQQQVQALTSVTEQLAKSLATLAPQPPGSSSTSGLQNPALPPANLDSQQTQPTNSLANAILGRNVNVIDIDSIESNVDKVNGTDKGNVSVPKTTEKDARSEIIPLTLALPNSNTQSGIHVPLDNDNKRDLSIDQWTSAFLVFQFIYIQRHPDQSPHLVSYLHIIRDLASRRARWLWYDEQFRHHKERSPDTPWNAPHLQLYVDALTVPSPVNPVTASQTSSTSTRRGGAPQNGLREIPNGYCFRFHRPDDQCFKAACHYDHSCYICNGAHKATQCDKKNAQTVANPRKR
ncbi:hypothetical protein Bbelb_082270 [Branchiostoma belcheri]|nr:hypothetical protein Bbelb_082270 [Branchiostoma belcheri]